MTRKTHRKRDTHLYMMCCCATSPLRRGDHWSGVIAISGTHHKLHSDKKKNNHRIREIFLCYLTAFFFFLIDPFLHCLYLKGTNGFSGMKHPLKEISVKSNCGSCLVGATLGNLFNCSTPLLYIFKRRMILLSF